MAGGVSGIRFHRRLAWGMDGEADVIVVGLGAAGSATLLALASRGVRCIGIDRFDPPHDRGSSHGRSRLIRLCYYEHPDYVPLLREAYRLWSELQSGTSLPVFRRTGGLYIGDAASPFVAGSLESARLHGLDHELLDRASVLERFPQFVVRPREVGFYEPTTGVLFPENAITATLARARELGARIFANERVVNWRAERGEVRVRSGGRAWRARSLVLCAGPWMSSMLPRFERVATVTRQVLAWFRPRESTALGTPLFPAWAISEPDGSAHYGFPMFPPERDGLVPGGAGFKVALHKPGEPSDPETVDREVRAEEIRRLADFVRERIPAGCDRDPDLLESRVCLYTGTRDGHFLIDKHPEHANVVVVSACSGHGFKFAPAMGAAAADLVVDGSSKLPIEFLSWRQGCSMLEGSD